MSDDVTAHRIGDKVFVNAEFTERNAEARPVVVAHLRKGSRVAYWQPNGVPEAIIEVNPHHPPRLHYLDGRPPVEFETSGDNEAARGDQWDPADLLRIAEARLAAIEPNKIR